MSWYRHRCGETFMCQCQYPFNGHTDNELWYCFRSPSKTNGFTKKVLMILVSDQGHQDQIHISRKVNAESATVLNRKTSNGTACRAEASSEKANWQIHRLCYYIYMQTHTCSLLSPSGMGQSFGGGCFSSHTDTSMYPASSCSSAAKTTDKHLVHYKETFILTCSEWAAAAKLILIVCKINYK